MLRVAGAFQEEWAESMDAIEAVEINLPRYQFIDIFCREYQVGETGGGIMYLQASRGADITVTLREIQTGKISDY